MKKRLINIIDCPLIYIKGICFMLIPALFSAVVQGQGSSSGSATTVTDLSSAPVTRVADMSVQPAVIETPAEMRTFPLTVSSRETLKEGLTMAKLSNGLTVFIQENHTAPVATVRCYVKNTGSAYETNHLGAGLSHVLEHVVAGGSTTKRTEKDIERLVDLMGGVTNAFTSSDMTAYFIDCPASDTPLAIELIADQMQHAGFVPAEFDREMNVVQQELSDGEVSRARVMWKMLSQTRFLVNPGKLPVIGYADVLNRTAHEDIINFYRERYIPNNQVFTVVGDIKTDEVLDNILKQFASTPRGAETEINMPKEPIQMSPRFAVREMEGATYDVAIFWPTVRLDDPDLYALDLMAYILGEGESSRLVRKYRMDAPKALSISSFSYTPFYTEGYFGVKMSLTGENYPNIVEEVAADLYALRDTLIPEQELAKARKQKEAELVFGQETVQSQADSLANSYISTGDPLFDFTYVKNLQKVTAEDIQRVARKYLVPERFNKVVIAPLGKGAQANALTETGQASDVTTAALDNGVKVIVRRIPNLPLINMQVYAKGGVLVETDKTAGLTKMAASMMEKGTAAMSAAEIAEYFDSIGGAYHISSGRNTISAAMTVLKDDFGKASEILSESFLRPAFPQAEFDKLKVLVLGGIERKKSEPRSIAMDTFFSALPETSAYHVIQGGTEESINAITLDDVKRFHQTYVQPSNMVVTVFGDIEPAEAIARVEKLFGTLKSNPVPPISFSRLNKLDKDVTLHKDTEQKTGIVVIGFEGPAMSQEKDYSAVAVLNAVMTGYGYPGGWIFPELRGEGLVYSVFGTNLSGPCPGFFIFMAQTRPDAVDEVITRLRRNISKAVNGEITQQEVDKAKKMILAYHAQDNTTAGSQASQAGVDEILGFGYDYDKAFEARINAVTLEQVRAVAKKYFRNSVQVTVSPKP